MCGWDFNYRDIDWEGIIGNLDSEEFLKVVQDNILKQLMTEPMRGTNILDLVLTNAENIISEVELEGELGCSDDGELRFTLDW